MRAELAQDAAVRRCDQIFIHGGLFLWRPGVVLYGACVIIASQALSLLLDPDI